MRMGKARLNLVEDKRKVLTWIHSSRPSVSLTCLASAMALNSFGGTGPAATERIMAVRLRITNWKRILRG